MGILKNKNDNKLSYRASVTVEASLSFTLAIFILFLIVGPLFILRKSSDTIVDMEKLNRMSCYYEEARYHGKKISSSSEAIKKVNDYIEGFDEADNFINVGYILYTLVKNNVDKNDPLCNIDNLYSLNENVYDEKTGVVKYDFLFSFKLPLNVLKIKNINQRFVVSRRAFIGASEDRFKEDEENDEIFLARNFKVYKVYHLNPTCTYLKKDLKSGDYGHIYLQRNESGEKYSQCSYCIKERVNDVSIYYYTMYGHLFHKNKNCPLMTAYVSKVSSDYIDKYNLKLCTRCEKKMPSEDFKENKPNE